MNGFNGVDPEGNPESSAFEKQLVHLQVRGRNQLLKEIVETHTIEDKVIDLLALHRNENTNELEGLEYPNGSNPETGEAHPINLKAAEVDETIAE